MANIFRAPPMSMTYFITVNGVANIELSVNPELHGYSWQDNATGSNLENYTISNGKVIWNDSTILQYNGVDVLPTDDIINNGVYTTRANEPTTGTIKFGSTAPTKYYLGNKAVDRIYIGNILLYKKESVPTGETWVLNDILHFGAKSWSYNVNFTSNGNSYNTFAFNFSSPLEAYLVYGSTNVYDTNSSWTNVAYKTITFETAPTGDLLTWLQANGTKQGGATLINFTIAGTAYQAEQGMTWAQWVDSSYNTSNGKYYISSDGYVKYDTGNISHPNKGSCKKDDTIQSGIDYEQMHSGGSGQ